jgi:hypothetical protein
MDRSSRLTLTTIALVGLTVATPTGPSAPHRNSGPGSAQAARGIPPGLT